MCRNLKERGYRELNNAGITQYSLYSMKSPQTNPHVAGVSTTWVFYSQKSLKLFIQTKHDETTRSCTEGPNFPPYTTMTAEDFLVNDSCIGGYFVTAETLLSDAVKAGVRLMAGESPAKIGDGQHTPDYHINWDVMRKKGYTISQLPDYIELHNTTLYDRKPLLARLLDVVGIVLSFIVVTLSILVSYKSIRRLRRNSRLMKEQAKQAIHDEQLLELALATSEAMMFDDTDKQNFLHRITPDEEYRDQVSAFFTSNNNAVESLQFHGSIDGQEPHWYGIRMESHNQDGNYSHSGFVLNIDHLKMIRKKAEEAHQLLLEAQAREGFISAMNHEIRTPLHAVVGFSLELARPSIRFSEEEMAMFADYIQSNAASLKKIINDILLVTLLSHSNVTAKCRSCSIESLLNKKYWSDAMALAKRRRNTVEIKPGGESVMVNADPKIVSTVMENLITNASLFSNEGSLITISWDCLDDGSAEIWVKDEGIGIEEKYHEVIFERFFKIDSFHPGCGLGLYICKTYMEKMNGKISCESSKDRGSVFKLTMNREPLSRKSQFIEPTLIANG